MSGVPARVSPSWPTCGIDANGTRRGPGPGVPCAVHASSAPRRPTASGIAGAPTRLRRHAQPRPGRHLCRRAARRVAALRPARRERSDRPEPDLPAGAGGRPPHPDRHRVRRATRQHRRRPPGRRAGRTWPVSRRTSTWSWSAIRTATTSAEPPPAPATTPRLAYPSARATGSAAPTGTTSARRTMLAQRAGLADKLLPLASAERLDLADGEQEIAPGVRLLPLPGHTPGPHGRRLHRRPGDGHLRRRHAPSPAAGRPSRTGARPSIRCPPVARDAPRADRTRSARRARSSCRTTCRSPASAGSNAVGRRSSDIATPRLAARPSSRSRT